MKDCTYIGSILVQHEKLNVIIEGYRLRFRGIGMEVAMLNREERRERKRERHLPFELERNAVQLLSTVP